MWETKLHINVDEIDNVNNNNIITTIIGKMTTKTQCITVNHT